MKTLSIKKILEYSSHSFQEFHMSKNLGSIECTKGVCVDMSYGVICTTRIASNTHPLPLTAYCNYILSLIAYTTTTYTQIKLYTTHVKKWVN